MEKVGIFTSRIVREELIEEEHSIIRYHHHHHPHHNHNNNNYTNQHHSDGIRKKKLAQNKELHRKAEKELKRMEKNDQSSLFGTKAVFTFVQPTEKLKITYREQQSRLRLAVARHRDLQEGAVLDTLEKGVGYPVIHVNFHPKTKQSSDLPPMNDHGSGPMGHGTRQKTGNHINSSTSKNTIAPSPSVGCLSEPAPHPHTCWSSSSSSSQVQKSSSSSSVNNHYRSSFCTSSSSFSSSTSNAKRSSSTSHLTGGKSGTNTSIPRLLKEDALGPSVHVQQGLYEEVKRIEPDFAFSPRDNIDTRAYIILGFKTLDTGFSSVLEQTWRDWTGARAIYLRLHNDFDLSKIVFYHRVHPKNDLDMFMYIVLVECWNVNAKNLIHILDFVQRMRVERLNGYISLYRDLGLEEEDSNYHSASQESLNNYAFEDQGIRNSLSPSAFSFANDVDETLDIIDEHQDLSHPRAQETETEEPGAIQETRHREVLVVETHTKKKKHHKHHKAKSHKSHSHHHHHQHQHHRQSHLHEPIQIQTDNIDHITVESRQIP